MTCTVYHTTKSTDERKDFDSLAEALRYVQETQTKTSGTPGRCSLYRDNEMIYQIADNPRGGMDEVAMKNRRVAFAREGAAYEPTHIVALLALFEQN